MTHHELPAIPNLMSEYGNAARDLLPVVGTKRRATGDPTTSFGVSGVTIDPAHVAAYAQATGLRLGNTLPLTYPYVLSFPLAIKVMGAPDFPFNAVGAVHLTNVIEQYRSLSVTDTLNMKVHAENLRPHRKGLLIDMVTEVEVAGELAWKQTSGFLAKGAKMSGSVSGAVAEDSGSLFGEHPAVPEHAPTGQWRVTPAQIKKYAQASGDKNPIHVSTLGAKAFGFPTTIAHGMWSAAAILAGVEGQIPDAARYGVEFVKPVVLPARVGYYAERSVLSERGWDFQLRKASKPTTLHAVARLEEL
ncbi:MULTISPECIES: MaoC family dehydratase [unclassified Corynebacterium]|uniref:MaoC family dehydratase n=1 Tax=unclassified Corynebacterium TaxID=2624378 RepID=UPI0029C9EFDD|nr:MULTISPECIES: MaoC/PaaZ C-terminal domain-containing protein [unclassified Corynebacterium]WPF66236.1 MaoC/PaaZ C-terminal domain-containing protein [Corynebacterium sp. 22KM0430]WPF68726.1 MaoC/PaaZ C-terminal domain-containing protein [Corynebacterium sp. 21KM1197]